MRRLGLTLTTLFILTALASPALAAETVRIEASRDATLIEDLDGALANGSGPTLFVGRSGQREGAVRRTLLLFDVASALPEGARIESAELTLWMEFSNPQPREIALHRVQADWSEGPSSASGGGGADAEPGDVTWIHREYPDTFWARTGGQRVARVSSRLAVGASGFYTWPSTVHTVQDVRLWASNPKRNSGWALIGDETTPQSVKRFTSREGDDPSRRPTLTITYTVPRGLLR